MKSRTQALSDFVNIAKPLEEARRELGAFEWNSDVELYTLTKARVIGVLERALKKEFLMEDLVIWADVLEGREDLAYEEGHEKEIAEILFLLSTPEINYPISQELIEKLVDELSHKDG